MQRLVIATVLAVACPATGFDASTNLRGHALAQQQPTADADDEDAGPEEAPTREEMLMAANSQQAAVAAPRAALQNPLLLHVLAQPQLQRRVQYQVPQRQMQQMQPSQQAQYQKPMRGVPQATMQEMVHEAEPAPAQMSAQQLQQMQQQLLQQQQLIQRQQRELQMQQQDLAVESLPQTQAQHPQQALPVQAAPVTMAALPKEWPPSASAAEDRPQQPPTKSLVAVGSRAGMTGGAATGAASGGVMSTLNGMPAAKPKGWDQCLRFARFVKSQGVTGQELVRVWTGTCTPAVRSGLATQRYKLMCSSLAGVVEPFGAQLDYSIDKLCSDVLAVFHDVTASDAAAR